MISTVIFDMDGVIIDSEPIHTKIEQQLFRELNLNVSEEEHSTLVGTSDKNFWQHIHNRYHLAEPVEELMTRKNDRYIRYIEENPDIQPMPGVVEFIKKLYKDGFDLILASSAMMKNIEIVLAKFALSKYFRDKVSGATLKHSKPHPEIFQIASQRAGTEPEKCLVIEDSKNGVQAAKAAEMKCIGFNSGNQDLSAADIVIHRFSEVTVRQIRSM